MRSSSAAILLVLAATCSGTVVVRQEQSRKESRTIDEEQALPPRVLGFDLARNPIQDPVLHDRLRLRKRQTLDLTVENEQTLYLLSASIGTPPQPIRLHVDTGSSDLWVNTPDSRFCSSRQDPCAFTGTYAANDSSSYRYLNSEFNISYADGSGASGDYVADTLRLPGAAVDNLQFGVGYVSSAEQNILGIGYASNEVQAGADGLQPYNNLPIALVSQGAVASNVYSLWLDDFDSGNGRLLFGGVDTSRFSGDLVSVPVQPTGRSSYTAFFVTLTALSMGGSELGGNMALAVLLDSGTSLTYLPDDMASDIFNQANVTYDDSSGIGLIDCGANASDTSIVFNFSSPASISVPMSELVLSVGNTTSTDPGSGSDSGPGCLFGIAPSGGSTVVLGDTFLRSAYVVYDLDNNQVSMAQSNVNATGTGNIVEVRNATALPSSVRAPDPVPARSGLPSQRGGGGGGGSRKSAAVPVAAAAASASLGGIMAVVALMGAYLV